MRYRSYIGVSGRVIAVGPKALSYLGTTFAEALTYVVDGDAGADRTQSGQHGSSTCDQGRPTPLHTACGRLLSIVDRVAGLDEAAGALSGRRPVRQIAGLTCAQSVWRDGASSWPCRPGRDRCRVADPDSYGILTHGPARRRPSGRPPPRWVADIGCIVSSNDWSTLLPPVRSAGSFG